MLGRCSVKERSAGGQMVAGFVVTYRSGGRCTQVRPPEKQMGDGKELPNARLETKKRKRE